MKSKYITVKLTEDQARFTANVLEENWATTGEPASKFAFDIRIVTKIRKALAQAKS